MRTVVNEARVCADGISVHKIIRDLHRRRSMCSFGQPGCVVNFREREL
jgi:hypothetical protein